MESDRPESRSMCTWPGLKISGVPLLRASSRGSPQKALSRGVGQAPGQDAPAVPVYVEMLTFCPRS